MLTHNTCNPVKVVQALELPAFFTIFRFEMSEMENRTETDAAARHFSCGVPADAGFLCDKAAVFRDAVKGTLLH
jgi:hypothetical protein